MCLDKITKRSAYMPDSAIAEKIVNKSEITGKYCPLDYDVGIALHSRPIGGGWAVRDDQFRILCKDGSEYTPGVHAYKNPQSHRQIHEGTARVKVLLRGPICEGVQDESPVLVYREMTILEELH